MSNTAGKCAVSSLLCEVDTGGRKGSACVSIEVFLFISPALFAAFSVGTTGGVVQSEAMYSSRILFP